MLTIQEVATAVGGRIVGERADDRPFSGVVVDSRQATPGALFVALRGEKHDGHDFVLEAFVKGARAALVERAPEESATSGVRQPLPLILVENTLAALQALARYRRRQLPMKVVGVTGSVGKTTAKEVISGVLGKQFSVLKSEGNMNTEIGLPLTLLKATPSHQVAVFEMGMYKLGEISTLARIAAPEVGVVTNVGPTHLERLGSVERIALAKGELVEELPEHGLAVLNFDDDLVRPMASRTRASVAYYGLDPRADFWADNVQSRGLKGIEFDLHRRSAECEVDGAADDQRTPHAAPRTSEWVHVPMPILGLHSIHAALAAATVAHHLGMPLEEIAAALHEVSPSLRLIVVAGINGSTIVDDTYNAGPASTLAALNLLAELEGRKVAVLGDMLELGSFEGDGHRMVGRRAADVADVLVVVGALGALIGREASDSGKGRESIFFASTNEEAIDQLRGILGPGDCVLVKGSRGMRMEQIVEAIRCPTP